MASITTQERNELTGLFIAMFNAAPGADYLSAMVSAREAGATPASIADNLASKPEFHQVYPAFLTAQEFADRAVANLLTSDTPAGAKAWATNWIIGKLNAGESAAAVLLQAAEALMLTENANYAAAQKLMLNRIEVANHYSITREQSSASLVELQAVLDGVTSDPASVTAAKQAVDGNLEGEVYTLTTGADTVKGTTGNDEIRALSVKADGSDGTTFSSFDAIDGGAGTDTLNIFAKDGNGNANPADAVNFNGGFPGGASVKNVEIINIHNEGSAAFGAVDASKFEGATSITQVAFADAVTKLGAGTTAGFKELSGTLNVTAADSASSASIHFDNVADKATLSVGATATGKLDTVSIAGTVVDEPVTKVVDPIATAITVGKDVQTLTLTTAVGIALTVTDGAGTKKVSSVDASASTGSIKYNAAGTVSDISTGSGKDDVTLNTVFSKDVTSASLKTGAGDDKLTVKVNDAANVNATVVVDAGDGKDSITIDTVAMPSTNTLKFTVNAGAGDDTVTLKNGIASVAEHDSIDGGAGFDTVVTAGKALAAEDYILLTEVITNFEGLKFSTDNAEVDASRLANYKSFEFSGLGSTIEEVANDQKITAELAVDATAAGYKAETKTDAAVYAGTLDITIAPSAPSNTGYGTFAYAETVNLTVKGATDKDGVSEEAGGAALYGDFKTANVTLVAPTDNAGTATDTSDDVYETPLFFMTTNTGIGGKAALTTLTLSGNGRAFVINGNDTKLTSIDASGLNTQDIEGNPQVGLFYTTENSLAETIKLGASLDFLNIINSTVAKSDTIEGLTLVDNATVAGKQVDYTKSDILQVRSNDDSTLLTGFEKTTVTAGSLNLALVSLAASTDDKVVFHFGGNTYIYGDVSSSGGAGNGVVDDTDVLIKLTGVLDLDLLVDML